MDRKNFFKSLGLTIGAIAVAPQVLLSKTKEPKIIREKMNFDNLPTDKNYVRFENEFYPYQSKINHLRNINKKTIEVGINNPERFNLHDIVTFENGAIGIVTINGLYTGYLTIGKIRNNTSFKNIKIGQEVKIIGTLQNG